MTISHTPRIHPAPHIDRLAACLSDSLNDRQEAREYARAQIRGKARARELRDSGELQASGHKFRMPDR